MNTDEDDQLKDAAGDGHKDGGAGDGHKDGGAGEGHKDGGAGDGHKDGGAGDDYKDGGVGNKGDKCQILKAQLFDDHLHRLWRTGALLKLYTSDEDCVRDDMFEVCYN